MSPIRILTAAVGLVAATGITAGATTAYLLRPGSSEAPSTVFTESPDDRPALAPVKPATRVGPAALRPAAAVPAPAAARPATVRSPSVAARPVAVPVSNECATTGDRILRIAKPGVVGVLLGAGLGAAGGAIADGGKAAGKGAMIGGLAGAVAGSAYGAYETKQECGTVLGEPGSLAGLGAGGDAGRIAITNLR